MIKNNLKNQTRFEWNLCGLHTQFLVAYAISVCSFQTELKEKTQELRKLRAEAANAKLQVDKVVSKNDGLKSKNQALEAMEVELTDQVCNIQICHFL